jgi:Ca2+-binding RTX toxin-like protein
VELGLNPLVQAGCVLSERKKRIIIMATLTGTASADTLTGGSGADSISGLDGADTLQGGDGDDTILGGTGDDSLVGGAGADLYIFDDGWGDDTLTDDGTVEHNIADFSLVADSGC